MSKGKHIKLSTLFISGVVLAIGGYLLMKHVSQLGGAVVQIVGQILILDAVITAIVRKLRRSKSDKAA